jgi:hypothetical protein
MSDVQAWPGRGTRAVVGADGTPSLVAALRRAAAAPRVSRGSGTDAP